MASVRELMAKMTPHGSSMTAVGRSAPEWTQHDIAAALGMAHITPLQSDLLRVKYCGDRVSEWSLVRHWYSEVHTIGVRRDWPRPDKDHLSWFVLSYASLYEHCREPKCPVCNGTRERVIGAKVIVCGECKGKGTWMFSERVLANWANIPRTTWQRTYTPLLADCRAELQTIEDRAIGIVSAKVRQEAIA